LLGWLVMASLTALSLTPSARNWLAATTSARVLESFDRACNLINQDNDILTLVTSERGLTPFALVVASESLAPFQKVGAGDDVAVTPYSIVVGPLDIRLSTITLWNPAPDWPMLQRMFANDPTRLGKLAEIVSELSSPASLLDLFRPQPIERTGLEIALLDRARIGAADLVLGLQQGHADQALAGAKRLAGLGNGLTPAGDDFLLGVSLAVWAGLYGKDRAEQVAKLIETACPLTTLLSAAYLRSAAQGECIAPWHTLFAALLLSDAEVTRMAAKSLMSIGHSSGCDGLAGFLAVHFFKVATA